MKKRYEKPSMKVYELKQKSVILAGSDSDQWGYVPGSDLTEGRFFCEFKK